MSQPCLSVLLHTVFPKTLNSKYSARCWKSIGAMCVLSKGDLNGLIYVYSDINHDTAPIIRGWEIQDGFKTAQGAWLEEILTVLDSDPDEAIFRQTHPVFSSIFDTCVMCSLLLFAETGVKRASVWDYFQRRIDGHSALWRVFAVSLT